MNSFYLRQLIWSLAGLALIGFVSLATAGVSRLLLKRKDRSQLDFQGQYIVGTGFILLIILIWNLFAPVNPVLFWSLNGLGIAFLVFSCRGRKFEPLNAAVVISSLIAAAVAFRCILDGLSLQAQIDGYHYTMVNWLHLTKTPPGLANLDGRLGFNSSNLLLAGFLSASPLRELALPFFNYSLLFVLSFASVRALQGRLFESQFIHHRSSDLYKLSLLIPVLSFAFTIRGLFPPSSLSSDLPALLLQLYTVYILIRVFESDTTQACSLWLAVWALTATFSVAIKLSSAAFNVASIAFLLVFPWARKALKDSLVTHSRIWVCTFFLILLWLIRGGILSGYILFPSLAIPLPVDWRVPYQYGVQLNALIADWGDMRFEDFLQSFGSIHSFISGQGLLFAVPTVLFAVGAYPLGKNAIVSVRYRYFLLTILASSLASLLAWWASAPDPRFVLSLAWIWGLLAFQALAQDLNPKLWLSVLAAAVVFCGPMQRVIIEVASFDRPVLFAVQEAFWRVPPGPTGIFRFPPPELRQIQTCGGVKVYTANYAWRAPLNTTDMHTQSSCLEARDPANQLAGFRIPSICKCNA